MEVAKDDATLGTAEASTEDPDRVETVSSETITVEADVHTDRNGQLLESGHIEESILDLSNLSIQSDNTVMEDLEEQLQTDPKKLIAKVKRMIAVNATKAKSFRRRASHLSTHGERSLQIDLVRRAMEKMNMYTEFLGFALDKELPEADLDEIQQLID